MWYSDDVEAIVYTLTQIVETGGDCIKTKDFGVCDKIGSTIPEEFLLCWEHYSGNRYFPVYDKYSSLGLEDQFYKLCPWEGNQLDLRLDLCRHLLPLFKNLLSSLG